MISRFVSSGDRFVEIFKSLREPCFIIQEKYIIRYGVIDGIVRYMFDIRKFNNKQIEELKELIKIKNCKLIEPVKILKERI